MSTVNPAAATPSNHGTKVEKTVTINRPVEDLFGFWRDFENLPKFMKHLQSVQVQDNLRSHWQAKAPLGGSVGWDAEITREIPDRLIAWKSLPGADVDNSGSVQFLPTARGTEVKVQITYVIPGGKIGEFFAKLTGEEPSIQVGDDLRRFKNLMEANEVPTTAGQPRG
ncbi:SRPBCC family protein [Candidatus Cyanaurora vandensis]|uniref:SRPBCC family protein n=1 Tax=Candidatus Cyanaurora vandensis TaxID=2714958 RepID=UPI00257EB687|nr:SRPBCC family protein [Candidatus Cyanaurora vandensis]